jgi:hypothetical protein
MRKLLSGLVLLTVFLLVGCTGYASIDTNVYTSAYINIGKIDSAIFVSPIKSVKYYGSQIEIETPTGTAYLTDEKNVTFIGER